MSAPTPSFVVLPDDSLNTGKQARTQSRVVNAQTVLEHFTIPISARSRTGIYFASIPIAVATAAHTALQGHAWIINPIGSQKKIGIRRVELSSIGTAVAAAKTGIAVERVTFTGTPTGATITAVRRDLANDVVPGADLRTASTGLALASVGNNAAAYKFWVVGLITAAGAAVPVLQEWEPDEDGQPILMAGEGLVFRQPDTGVSSDPRSVIINLAWEEFE